MTCATGTIAPYVPSAEQPWNRQRAMHLYRRMGFGATHAQLNTALTMNPTTLVNQLVNFALAAPLPDAPVWYDWTRQPIDDYTDYDSEIYTHREEWAMQWLKDMLTVGFREKMALFWHNHFVTEWDTYGCSAYLYEYHKLLQQYALGNFKQFVYDMGINPAMLIYLNGNTNTKESPNENYARELMELFTMGRDNGYTQSDIVEMARALTGWYASYDSCEPASFDAENFDDEDKTILAKTGNFNYDDVIDLIFNQRTNEVATYICTKLYKHFISNEVDTLIVNQLAATFITNNFEIAPVMRQLFKSEHFFNSYNIGPLIKSPVELYLYFVKVLELPYEDGQLVGLYYALMYQGQELFSPPNVAGWPGQRAWINENTLTERWSLLADAMYYLPDSVYETMRTIAIDLTGNSTNPADAAAAIVNHLLVNGVPFKSDYGIATDVFKSNIPQNYFDQGLWSLEWDEALNQMRVLLGHLIKLPEFQMN